MDFDSLKYRDLQKLAKEAGIKANQPKAQLVQALQDHQQHDQPQNGEDQSRFVEFTAKDEDKKTSTPKRKKKSSSSIGTSSDKKKKTPMDKTPKSSNITPKNKTPAQTKNRTPSQANSKQETPIQAKNRTPKATNTSKTNADKTPVQANSKTPGFMSATMASASRNKATKKLPPKSSLKGSSRHRSSTLRAHFSGTPGSVQKAKASFAKTPHSKRKKEVIQEEMASKIPQFVSRRPPNFAKMHAQQFDKMDSLDEYLKKKQERTGKKEERAKSRVRKENQGPRRSPRLEQVAGFAPTTTKVDPAKFNFLGRKSAGNSKPFVFSAASPCNRILSNISNTKKVETPGKKFDLKASLAKGLSYRPHKGKLGEEKKKQVSGKTASSLSKVEDIKSQSVKQIKGVRLNKRAELLLQRRNLAN